jgi:hypothetical protein
MAEKQQETLKTYMLTVRVTPAEQQALRQMAEQRGQSAGAVVRNLLAKAAEAEKRGGKRNDE